MSDQGPITSKIRDLVATAGLLVLAEGEHTDEQLDELLFCMILAIVKIDSHPRGLSASRRMTEKLREYVDLSTADTTPQIEEI